MAVLLFPCKIGGCFCSSVGQCCFSHMKMNMKLLQIHQIQIEITISKEMRYLQDIRRDDDADECRREKRRYDLRLEARGKAPNAKSVSKPPSLILMMKRVLDPTAHKRKHLFTFRFSIYIYLLIEVFYHDSELK